MRPRFRHSTTSHKTLYSIVFCLLKYRQTHTQTDTHTDREIQPCYYSDEVFFTWYSTSRFQWICVALTMYVNFDQLSHSFFILNSCFNICSSLAVSVYCSILIYKVHNLNFQTLFPIFYYIAEQNYENKFNPKGSQTLSRWGYSGAHISNTHIFIYHTVS